MRKTEKFIFNMGMRVFLNDEPHEGLEYYNLALSAGFDSDEMFSLWGWPMNI